MKTAFLFLTLFVLLAEAISAPVPARVRVNEPVTLNSRLERRAQKRKSLKNR